MAGLWRFLPCPTCCQGLCPVCTNGISPASWLVKVSGVDASIDGSYVADQFEPYWCTQYPFPPATGHCCLFYQFASPYPCSIVRHIRVIVANSTTADRRLQVWFYNAYGITSNGAYFQKTYASGVPIDCMNLVDESIPFSSQNAVGCDFSGGTVLVTAV